MTHPNKHIREALAEAVAAGYRSEPAGKSGHAWGILKCPHAARGGCLKPVYGTPRVPENEAEQIRRFVRQCPHR